MPDPVLTWARSSWPGRTVTVAERSRLTGGVSGAVVERIGLSVAADDGIAAERVDVVLKQTDGQELDAMLALAELGEPVVPPVLGHWSDRTGGAADRVWVVLPWYPADPLGLVAVIPESVLRAIARIHRAFIDRPDRWPTTLEAVDAGFCRRALGEYLPETMRRTGSAAAAEIGSRALALADRLLADATFVDAPGRFPATLLHGDLHGLNVLRPRSPAAGLPDAIMIDWNAARLGPGMFDVAMTEPSLDSPGTRAYIDEWQAVGGPDRDFEAEFGWAATLVNTIYTVVVADRGDPAAAAQMVDRAILGYGHWCRITAGW